MTVVYLLAHFDDEFGCLPMIWRATRDGEAQHFLYLADYRSPRTTSRRFAETRAFLAAQGIDPGRALHVGAGSGAWDGAVHRAAPAALAAVEAALARIGPVDRLVVPAWEGGHMDHDVCALIAARLATRPGGPGVRQYAFYNGQGLAGPLLRNRPLAQNGPVTPMPLTLAQRLRWLAAVRWFPSQLFAWAGIWPAMAWSVAWRGFGWQRLDPARVDERPHAGALFYERMFGISYAEVRGAADESLK
jgi:LmbE family N-acetylglucosaminyl deacetylase